MSDKFLGWFIYIGLLLLGVLIIRLHLRIQMKKYKATESKINKPKDLERFEPVSLYPVIDNQKCIHTAACVQACPEKDIIGIANGKEAKINTYRCLGHSACCHACQAKPIPMLITTAKR